MQAAARVATALEAAREAIATSQLLSPDVLGDLQDVVALIAASIADSPDAALVLSDLAAADEYTHRHSVNVTALGLLLGRAYWRTEGWVDYRGVRRWDKIDDRLAKLGMGLLLHDIGKMVVPAEVLGKPERLDEEEWRLIRTHPEAGVALLDAATDQPARAQRRARPPRALGRQRLPARPAGEGIGEFPRIAAIADVFDAVTSQRAYAAAEPPHVGVRIISGGAGTAFDRAVVRVFRKVVMPYPSAPRCPAGRPGRRRGRRRPRAARGAGRAHRRPDVRVDLRTAAA